MDEITMKNQLLMEKFLRYKLITKKLKTTSIETYRALLKKYISYLSAESIFLANVNDNIIVSFLGNTFSKDTPPRTHVSTLRVIKYFHKYLVENDLSKKKPKFNIEMPRIVKNQIILPSNEVIEQLLNQPVEKKYNSLKNISIAELLFGCGLRATEAASLKLFQLNIEKEWVDVEGKGDKNRSLPFNKRAKNRLAEFLVEREKKYPGLNDKNDYLFVNFRKEALTRQGIWHIVKSLVQSAGLDMRIYPHLLRHAFATSLLEENMGLMNVQRLMGHSNPNTTNGYYHPRKKALKKNYEEKHPRAQGVTLAA